MSPRANWSRKLPTPLEIGKRKLRTLHDLRAHLLKLPESEHEKPGWQAAAAAMMKAAEDGDVKHAVETFRFARFVHRES